MMMILVASFSSLIIYIFVGVSPIQTQTHLEYRLCARPFDPGIGIVAATGILPLYMMDHGVGNIVPVIRDMGIDMTAGLVVVGNHFPTVVAAMIRKIGMPFFAGGTPASVPGFRIIPLKITLYRSRNRLIAPVLCQDSLTAQQQKEKKEFVRIHNSRF